MAKEIKMSEEQMADADKMEALSRKHLSEMLVGLEEIAGNNANMLVGSLGATTDLMVQTLGNLPVAISVSEKDQPQFNVMIIKALEAIKRICKQEQDKIQKSGLAAAPSTLRH